MKRKLRHLIWTLFGRPELPPRYCMVTYKTSSLTGRPIVTRAHNMAFMYSLGFSVETIAKNYCVTRERVRQCLWKVYREGEL